MAECLNYGGVQIAERAVKTGTQAFSKTNGVFSTKVRKTSFVDEETDKNRREALEH